MLIDKSFRLAATMMLLRDTTSGIEVFMVERHRQIEFSSGALVYPGGSLDPDDHLIAARPDLALPQDIRQDIQRDITGPALLSLRIAAIRETFEESGHLLARLKGEPDIVSSERMRRIEQTYRQALAEGRIPFSDVLSRENLVLAMDGLVSFAHWITPVQEPKRFDTHFFVAEAPPGQSGHHDGHEMVNSLWLSPQAAIDAQAEGRFKIVFPTMRTLIKLNRHRTVADVLAEARREPVITVQPEMSFGEGYMRLKIPADCGYDGEVFDFKI